MHEEGQYSSKPSGEAAKSTNPDSSTRHIQTPSLLS
jgi:hypothetical protein